MNEKNLNKLITEALLIEEDAAKEAGALGYMARSFVQATLPHKQVKGNEFKRKNGLFKLTMLADSETGLPYGNIPRLLLAWIATEVIKKKEKELLLGKTLTSFMEQLDLVPTGGKWGSITRLKEQMKRLFSCAISCTYDDGEHWAIKNITPVSSADLWWNPKKPDQLTLFESTITLSDDFFKEIIASPVPIDMRVLKILKRSPLAIDMYCWLTYRLSYLKKETIIPWFSLQFQFGSDYAVDSQGVRNFKKAFLRELKKIYVLYPEAKIEFIDDGLILKPSPTHIKKLST
jgi:hypothetical protein